MWLFFFYPIRLYAEFFFFLLDAYEKLFQLVQFTIFCIGIYCCTSHYNIVVHILKHSWYNHLKCNMNEKETEKNKYKDRKELFILLFEMGNRLSNIKYKNSTAILNQTFIRHLSSGNCI